MEQELQQLKEQFLQHKHTNVDQTLPISVLNLSGGLKGTKIYYVSDTSGGAVTRKLTFFNGVLISET